MPALSKRWKRLPGNLSEAPARWRNTLSEMLGAS